MSTAEATEKETPTVTPPSRDMNSVARKLMAPAVEAVTTFLDDGPEKTDALGMVLSFTAWLGETLTTGRQKRIDRLSAEQITLAEQCRQQAEVYKAADLAVSAYLATKRARHAAFKNATSQLSSWDSQRDSLGRWPTGAALREYETKRVSLKAAVDTAQSAWEDTFEEERRLIGIRTAEELKLQKLDQAESIIKARLSGKMWTDPNFGLPNAPEL
jgi:hypothetical protein